MTKEFDLIVIGSGSSGSTAAMKCRANNWNVAVIDSQPFGGTCALRGCDPKKVLVGAAEVIDLNERMNGKGIHSKQHIDWKDLISFKSTFTKSVPDNKEKALSRQGIETFHGKASFVSESEIEVNGQTLIGKHFLIASGSKPAPLPIEGEEYLTYSDEFLELEDMPKTIVFVGGGYISFEFAHIAARSGANVHIINSGKRVLEDFEADHIDLLMKKSEELGIRIHTQSTVTSINKNQHGYTVKAKRDDEEINVQSDLVVHGAGRVPALEMNLEKGNVEREKRGVRVNEYLQSISNPRVYAAGDVVATEGLPLTPVASMESHIVSSNLLKGNNKKIDYPVIPTALFTVPKVASVGMTEKQAHESDLNIKVNTSTISNWFTYKRTNESYAAYKILINEDTDKIVGAHLISNEADELINHFATAIRFQLTTKELKQTIFAYPTAGSDIAHMI